MKAANKGKRKLQAVKYYSLNRALQHKQHYSLTTWLCLQKENKDKQKYKNKTYQYWTSLWYKLPKQKTKNMPVAYFEFITAEIYDWK